MRSLSGSDADRIGAGEDLLDNPHLLTCERCRALVQDLQYIAEAASQLVPIEIEPREDLWAQIQDAIARGELGTEKPEAEEPVPNPEAETVNDKREDNS